MSLKYSKGVSSPDSHDKDNVESIGTCPSDAEVLQMMEDFDENSESLVFGDPELGSPCI